MHEVMHYLARVPNHGRAPKLRSLLPPLPAGHRPGGFPGVHGHLPGDGHSPGPRQTPVPLVRPKARSAAATDRRRTAAQGMRPALPALSLMNSNCRSHNYNQIVLGQQGHYALFCLSSIQNYFF